MTDVPCLTLVISLMHFISRLTKKIWPSLLLSCAYKFQNDHCMYDRRMSSEGRASARSGKGVAGGMRLEHWYDLATNQGDSRESGQLEFIHVHTRVILPAAAQRIAGWDDHSRPDTTCKLGGMLEGMSAPKDIMNGSESETPSEAITLSAQSFYSSVFTSAPVTSLYPYIPVGC
jgi:hypothetical protein